MVWQRAGTVSVQNGSTTVVGANVDFAAGSRNGDSFIGPDGLTYEVANVASSTVISILPAYKGATVSGAGYAIMPVQGYDKMLSDAFNNLNNQFGPKLAALGTTGNYDILPLQKGGTGANDKAGAQTALEIPTADTPLAIGRGGTGNKLGAATKLATPRNINGTPFDATTDITIDVGYKKTNILGLVSQTSGVPTGAIIERGGNSQGVYVKYADGTMTCFKVISGSSIAVTNAYGSIFASTALALGSYAATFARVDNIDVIALGADGACTVGFPNLPAPTGWPSIYLFNPVSGAKNVNFEMRADGVWFL